MVTNWNKDRVYSTGDIVYYAGKFWESTIDSNSGNDPIVLESKSVSISGVKTDSFDYGFSNNTSKWKSIESLI